MSFRNKNLNIFASLVVLLLLGASSVIATTCGTLNYANGTGGVFTMANGVASDETCYTINGHNVTLDCNGQTINYSATGFGRGVSNSGYENLTVKNCLLNQTTSQIGSGVYLTSANHSLIQNVNFSGVGHASYSDFIESSGCFNTTIKNSWFVSSPFPTKLSATWWAAGVWFNSSLATAPDPTGYLYGVSNMSRYINITMSNFSGTCGGSADCSVYSNNFTGCTNCDACEDPSGSGMWSCADNPVLNCTAVLIEAQCMNLAPQCSWEGTCADAGASCAEMSEEVCLYAEEYGAGCQMQGNCSDQAGCSGCPAESGCAFCSAAGCSWNNPPETWMVLNVSYEDADFIGKNESNIHLWHVNSSSVWDKLIYSVVNEDENYCSYNFTGGLGLSNSVFKTFAPMVDSPGEENCRLVSTSGVYTMNRSYYGENITNPDSGHSCVLFNASDIYWDCNGYNLTGAGAYDQNYGFYAYELFSNITIVNCSLVQNYSVGGKFINVNNSVVNNNTFYNNTLNGFVFENVDYSNFTNNNASYSSTPVRIAVGSVDCNISNNWVFGTSTGMTIGDENHTIQDNTILVELPVGFTGGQAVEWSCSHCEFARNFLNDTGIDTAGLYLSSSSASNFTDSTIYAAVPIKVLGSSSDYFENLILNDEGSSVSSSISAGIYLENAQNEVFNNVSVTHSIVDSYVVYISSALATGNVFYNNTWNHSIIGVPVVASMSYEYPIGVSMKNNPAADPVGFSNISKYLLLTKTAYGECSGTPDACLTFGDEPTCNSMQGCSWDGLSCVGDHEPCRRYSNSVDCSGNVSCSWSDYPTWCQVNLTYADSDVPVEYDASNVTIKRWSGSAWADVAVTGTNRANNYTFGNTTSFSQFGAFAPELVLPSIQTNTSYLNNTVVYQELTSNITANDSSSGILGIWYCVAHTVCDPVNFVASDSIYVDVNFSGLNYLFYKAENNLNANSTLYEEIIQIYTAPNTLQFVDPTYQDASVINDTSSDIYVNYTFEGFDYDTCLIDFNGTNYTASLSYNGSGGGYCFRNFTSEVASYGNYSFTGYLNDSIGSWSSTGTRSVYAELCHEIVGNYVMVGNAEIYRETCYTFQNSTTSSLDCNGNTIVGNNPIVSPPATSAVNVSGVEGNYSVSNCNIDLFQYGVSVGGNAADATISFDSINITNSVSSAVSTRGEVGNLTISYLYSSGTYNGFYDFNTTGSYVVRNSTIYPVGYNYFGDCVSSSAMFYDSVFNQSVDVYLDNGCNVTFVNSTFNKSLVTILAGEFNVFWHGVVHVITPIGSGVPFASVQVNDSNSLTVQDVFTDINGTVMFDVQEYMQNSSGVFNLTPHLVYANESTYGSNSTLHSYDSVGSLGYQFVELTLGNSFCRVDLNTNHIWFGTLAVNTNTGAVNQNVTITNTGSFSGNLTMKGYDWYDDVFNSFSVNHTHWDTLGFTYPAGNELNSTDYALQSLWTPLSNMNISYGVGVPLVYANDYNQTIQFTFVC